MVRAAAAGWPAPRDEPAAWPEGRQVVACDLLRTELLRAVHRADPDALVRARQILADDLDAMVTSR